TSSVMPNAFLAVEHRMYLPLAPVIVLGVLGVDALARGVLPDVGPRRALEAAALGVVGVGLSLRTIQRNRDYRDEIALWSSTISCLPGNGRGHFNLGNSLMGAGRIDEAIVELQRAVALQPNFPDARLSLGNAFMIKGDVEQAVAEYERTLPIHPHHAGSTTTSRPSSTSGAIRTRRFHTTGRPSRETRGTPRCRPTTPVCTRAPKTGPERQCDTARRSGPIRPTHRPTSVSVCASSRRAKR